MREPARRSPLHRHWTEGWPAEWRGEDLSLTEMPFAGMLLLRGRLEPSVTQRVADALGHALPEQTRVLSGAGPHTLMIAPARWAVLAEAAATPAVLSRLEAAVAGSGLAVSDISDGWVGVAIEGARAAELLAAGTAIDLHPRAFRPGEAAQTQLARTTSLIWRLAPDRFRLFVDSSCAEYAWRWLTTHARLVTACPR